MQRFFNFVKEHPILTLVSVVIAVVFINWIWGGGGSSSKGGGAVYNVQPDPYTIMANKDIAIANAQTSAANVMAQVMGEMQQSKDNAAVTIATHNADTHLALAGLQKDQTLSLADKAVTTHEMDLQQERYLSNNALKAYGWSLAGAPVPTNVDFGISPNGLPYYMDDARTWTAAFGNPNPPVPAPTQNVVVGGPMLPVVVSRGSRIPQDLLDWWNRLKQFDRTPVTRDLNSEF